MQIDRNPFEKLKMALIRRNIPLAESVMEELAFRMGKVEFFDSDVSFKKKTEYLGCLVAYVSKVDKEADIEELVEKVCNRLEYVAFDEEPSVVAQIYNHPNRLYFGIYSNTGNEEWLYKAIEMLKKAISISKEVFLCFNLALCVSRTGDYEGAVEYKYKIDHRGCKKVPVCKNCAHK